MLQTTMRECPMRQLLGHDVAGERWREVGMGCGVLLGECGCRTGVGGDGVRGFGCVSGEAGRGSGSDADWLWGGASAPVTDRGWCVGESVDVSCGSAHASARWVRSICGRQGIRQQCSLFYAREALDTEVLVCVPVPEETCMGLVDRALWGR